MTFGLKKNLFDIRIVYVSIFLSVCFLLAIILDQGFSDLFLPFTLVSLFLILVIYSYIRSLAKRKYTKLVIKDIGVTFKDKGNEIFISWDEVTNIKWINLIRDSKEVFVKAPQRGLPGFVIYSADKSIRINIEFENFIDIVSEVQKHVDSKFGFNLPMEIKLMKL